MALVVEKDKRWRRERKENFCVRDDDERKAKRKTFVRFVYEKWPHEYYSKFFLRNNLHVLNRMSSAKDDRDDDNTIDEDEIDDWLDSDDDDGTKKEADEAMPVEDNNNDAVMKQQEQQQLVRETKMKEEEEEEEEAKREHEDQERKNRERAELEACQAAEITAARKKHEARIRESEKQEEAAKVQRAAAEAAAKEEEEREARHKLEVEKREREEFTMKARAQAEAVELKARREAESAVERVRIEEEEEEEEEEEGEQQQQQRQEEEEEEEERRQQQQAQQQQQQQERGQQQREKELETPKAVFEADKSEQPHASTHIDAVGERETAYPDHQGQNEFDDLAQSSTIVGSLFGGFKALKSAASKTVTTVKTHEFTRQMTSDIRELSRHIAGDDVASSSKTKGTTTTTTHGENVQNQQQGRTRQSTRDEVDALEIAEKLASKTWHAIGDFTTKGKKLANDVEGSIREKGVGATAEKYGKNALFGIEKVLSNATKVITAGIEDGTNGTSRLAENLQEYGVFEYLDSIDMNTKEAEESFKALDSEAANFMAKACADILSPHVSDEIGSPLKINTNQEFEEMDIHLHEAETSPVKKSGKIHAKKIIDLVQRIRMLLKEVMEKPEQNPTKKALSLIEIAESELESTRESVIVGFTELTILACQKFEKVSEELHPKNKMDVSVWGSTVESRAKYVETEIGRIENEMRSFRNVVANEVEALNTISVEQVGEVNISNIPTVSEVVSSFIENVDDDLLECFNIFEDAKGMIIPSIVVSCL